MEEGTQRNGRPDQVTWRCDPAWEARCFATCPHDVWQFRARRSAARPWLFMDRESDTFLKPAAERFKRKLPSAELVGMENTSHFVPMERPEETTTAILNFLVKNRLIDLISCTDDGIGMAVRSCGTENARTYSRNLLKYQTSIIGVVWYSGNMQHCYSEGSEAGDYTFGPL